MHKRQAFSGDAVIAGAGFAGMYMLHRLRLIGLSAVVLEAGSGVGGTWYWNRYPGARCDVESMQYSFSFDDELQQAWDWSERYATQGEILRYANHVADRFGLRPDIRFETPVERASYDEESGRWQVETPDEVYDGRFLILATGCLSSPNQPPLPGQDDFGGKIYHTGRWPHHEVDFKGKRVGVIGTGSSGIQAIPVIARDAQRLTVFQRSPNFAVPAHNRALDPTERAGIKANYAGLRADALSKRSLISYPVNSDNALEVDAQERARVFDDRWERGGLGFNACFADQLLDLRANAFAADYVREKIRSRVADANTAELLSPKSVLGCKRLCVDSGYYETFNEPHVELVDLNQSPVEGFDSIGLRAGGRHFPLDIAVMATGFDAMTGSILKIDIRGKSQALSEAWAEGPKSYLGLGVYGFPNLFTITGPGSPSVLSNMLMSIEQHVEWLSGCLAAMKQAGQGRIEATAQAQSAWVDRVREIAETTLYPTCNSWYLGANIPGKKRVFMPHVGCPSYREYCNNVAASGYSGFARSS